MSIWSKIGKVFASWGAEDDRWYSPGGSFYGGFVPSQSGVAVDSDSAMRLMTVHNCVKVLSQSVAQLPLHFMKQAGQMKEKAFDHPYYRLLHDQPNSWMTSFEFWGMVVAHISLRGNFYGYKLGLPGRPVQEIIPVNPDSMTKVTQNEDYSITYTIRLKDGTTKDFGQDKIMHLRGLALNGFLGLNPIEYAREAVGLGIANERFMARYFGKGMHPGAVIKHPLPLSSPAHAKLKENLKEKYAGLGNSWDLMLIDEGMDVVFPDIKLVDAQFLELGKFKMSEIAGMFRVPLMLLQAGDAPTTYASAEQFMLALANHALTPILVNIEQAIKRDLLNEQEKATYYAKFSMAGLMRGDMKSRYDAYAVAIDKEILNPNECRDLEDYNPYEGGDEYRTRTSTVKQAGTPAQGVTE